MKFSVIIPTCSRPDALLKCLETLQPGAQSIAPVSYEVMVSDDSSDPQTKDLLLKNYAWAQWTEGPRRGPAANRNHGARLASGEWLAFTDDDCIPTRDWLAAFQRAINQQPSVRVLEGRTFADRPRKSLAEHAPINETGGLLWSCNFCIERKLFLEMGGFDDRFRFAAMEDAELALRLRKRGENFLFVPDAAVCHPWRLIRPESRRRHDAATLTFLQIHPEQRAQINARYYFRLFLQRLIKQTIPGALRYRGEGLAEDLRERAHEMTMAFRLLKP